MPQTTEPRTVAFHAAYLNSIETVTQHEVSGIIQRHWMAPEDASEHAGRISDTVATALYCLALRRMPLSGSAPDMSHSDWMRLRYAIIEAIRDNTPEPTA